MSVRETKKWRVGETKWQKDGEIEKCVESWVTALDPSEAQKKK